MTKKQAVPERATPRLDPTTVARAALELLDEKGLETLSTRAVAERLGVRMNTVLWHVKSKARLLELMADSVLGEIPLDDLPDAWYERAHALAHRYRRALLTHRDGASLVTGTYSSEPHTLSAEPHTLRFADTFAGTLLDGGMTERQAAWTTLAVSYFTLGLTQEEQAAPQPGEDRLDPAVTETSHPALHRVRAHLNADSFDERFTAGISALLTPEPPLSTPEPSPGAARP